MKELVTGIYFSPTGGTRCAAETVCKLLGSTQKILDFTLPIHRETVELGPEDILVAAVPVYAGRVPAVPHLLDRVQGHNTPCLAVVAYGNRHYDDALAQWAAMLTERGFQVVGAAAVVTPHVFAPTLGAGRPNEEDCQILKQWLTQVEEKLSRGECTAPQLPGEAHPEPKASVPVEKDRDWDTCMGCADCAKACPVGAMNTSTLLWDDKKCISCMSCVSHCPTGALGYNSSAIASRLTAQYAQPRAVEVFL